LTRWEHSYYPVYYFSQSDVVADYLRDEKPGKQDSETIHDLVVGTKSSPGAVTVFTSGEFKGLVKIAFKGADAWFEEDERIYSHPKDPYKVGCFC
jgi:hypothetical protein